MRWLIIILALVSFSSVSYAGDLLGDALKDVDKIKKDTLDKATEAEKALDDAKNKAIEDAKKTVQENVDQAKAQAEALAREAARQAQEKADQIAQQAKVLAQEAERQAKEKAEQAKQLADQARQQTEALAKEVERQAKQKIKEGVKLATDTGTYVKQEAEKKAKEGAQIIDNTIKNAQTEANKRAEEAKQALERVKSKANETINKTAVVVKTKATQTLQSSQTYIENTSKKLQKSIATTQRDFNETKRQAERELAKRMANTQQAVEKTLKNEVARQAKQLQKQSEQFKRGENALNRAVSSNVIRNVIKNTSRDAVKNLVSKLSYGSSDILATVSPKLFNKVMEQTLNQAQEIAKTTSAGLVQTAGGAGIAILDASGQVLAFADENGLVFSGHLGVMGGEFDPQGRKISVTTPLPAVIDADPPIAIVVPVKYEYRFDKDWHFKTVAVGISSEADLKVPGFEASAYKAEVMPLAYNFQKGGLDPWTAEFTFQPNVKIGKAQIMIGPGLKSNDVAGDWELELCAEAGFEKKSPGRHIQGTQYNSKENGLAVGDCWEYQLVGDGNQQ